MTARADDALQTLTEKEKQTLRLIVRGHDAKSVARSLGLSVHTINERLRDARRKLAVSSSREAARLLFDAEGGAVIAIPKPVGDREIGAEIAPAGMDIDEAPTVGTRRIGRRHRTIIGVLLMSLVFAFAALTLAPQVAPTLTQPAQTADAPNAEVVSAARAWLALLDEARWPDSYRATGTAFRRLNTLAVWTDVSNKVRAPLGEVKSRTFLSQENLPAPPSGYEVVKFRTTFATKADAIETVTLDREDGAWRVVGVTVG